MLHLFHLVSISNLYLRFFLLLTALYYGRIQALENECMRKLFSIFYWEHITNAFVRKRVEMSVERQEPLLATVKRRNNGGLWIRYKAGQPAKDYHSRRR